MSADGKRCEATHLLEFDHIVPYALGGTATAGNIRLRCRTHNQLEAERTFGTAFMDGKRQRGMLTASGAPIGQQVASSRSSSAWLEPNRAGWRSDPGRDPERAAP